MRDCVICERRGGPGPAHGQPPRASLGKGPECRLPRPGVEILRPSATGPQPGRFPQGDREANACPAAVQRQAPCGFRRVRAGRPTREFRIPTPGAGGTLTALEGIRDAWKPPHPSGEACPRVQRIARERRRGEARPHPVRLSASATQALGSSCLPAAETRWGSRERTVRGRVSPPSKREALDGP